MLIHAREKLHCEGVTLLACFVSNVFGLVKQNPKTIKININLLNLQMYKLLLIKNKKI